MVPHGSPFRAAFKPIGCESCRQRLLFGAALRFVCVTSAASRGMSRVVRGLLERHAESQGMSRVVRGLLERHAESQLQDIGLQGGDPSFNGTAAAPTSWSASSIATPVPSAAI